MMAQRIIAGIVLLLSIFLVPFWLQAILALALLFYFKNYYEFMFAFLISDLLYAVPEARFFGIQLFLFFASVAVFIMVSFLKTKLSIYESER